MHSPVNIVFCGSIERNKNVHSILRACRILIKEGVPIRIEIIGKRQNQNDKYLKSIERQLECIDGIIKERLQFSELIKEYASSDIFVMPSFTETFGLVYAEALSQGLPVLYTKNEGFDGFFDDGEIGKAVAAENVNDIANGIKYVIGNYDKIQNNISTIDFTIFDWDNIGNQYLKLYQEIIHN